MKLVKDTNKLSEKKHKVSDEKAQEAIRTIFQWIGEDPDREGLASTPKRVIKAFKEYFQGYDQNPNEYLSKAFKEHPASTQSSFKIKELNRLAIIEEIIFNKLSFRFFLIPPTNEYIFFEKYIFNNLGISFGLF